MYMFYLLVYEMNAVANWNPNFNCDNFILQFTDDKMVHDDYFKYFTPILYPQSLWYNTYTAKTSWHWEIVTTIAVCALDLTYNSESNNLVIFNT